MDRSRYSNRTLRSSRWTRTTAVLCALAATLVGGVVRSLPTQAATPPNIVLILADDMDSGLMSYTDPQTGQAAMPNLQSLLAAKGMTFDEYFVTDSLCCPSRSSLLRGQYPHNTGIFTNGGTDGGFGTFYRNGEESTTIGTQLQAAGYVTGFAGKYLNGYMQPGNPAPQSYVPPGWTEWNGIGDGYAEYNYWVNHNGKGIYHGSASADYGVDVLSSIGAKFIGTEVAAGKPFFLELSTFAPHAPYTPAPRHASDFPNATAPRPPSFNEADLSDKPSWLSPHPSLTDADIANLDTDFRLRLQSVEGVDDMIGSVVNKLTAMHALDNTYLVFASDNGYHLGEHRMYEGKLTAYDSDIHVPLVIRGPGVAAGVHTSAMVENVDLAPTFEAIAGATSPAFTDGASALPILQSSTPQGWRTAVLIEHHAEGAYAGLDPDVQLDQQAHHRGPGARPGGYTVPPYEMPTSYEALRTATQLYVEYANGEGEFYDYTTDPDELNNSFATMDSALKSQLSSELHALEACAGVTCTQAARPRR
jgi:arylsulfatase A-like enzyme